jgi:DNA-binding SARP family transcriptional activator
MPLTPGLRIRLLGPLEIDGVDPARFGSRKARTLFRLLALADGVPVSTDQIVDAVWGDDPTARPTDQVAVLVSRLRTALRQDAIRRTDAGYSLTVEWLDLRAARELVAEARRRVERGAPAAGRAAAEAAVRLFRGPLLAGEQDAPWVLVPREAARRLENEARQVAALAALAAGDYRSAVAAADEALAHDAHDEVAVRVAMVALSRLGHRSASLDRYEALRTSLAEELGVAPSPETSAIHLAVLQDREPPPVAGAAAPIPPATAAPEVPPGRDAAVRAFTSALDRAASGRATLLDIEGDAGMGKTHLLRALTAHAQAFGSIALATRCDELGRALPLSAVLEALGAHLVGLGGTERNRVLGEDSALLEPLLDWRAGPAASDRWLGALADPTAGRLLLYSALLRAVDRLGDAAPAVLLIDDAHRAAEPTIDWLRYVRRNGDGVRLLVVTTRRTHEGPDVDADQHLILEPIDIEAAATLVGRHRAAELLARSGGNPLFLLELADAPQDALPPSLVASVQERCARTGDAAPVLRNAAVLGTDIDVDLLASVLRSPAIELLDSLEVGVAHDLLDDADGRLSFRHALVREALVEQTRSSRRALLHREAGRTLAARTPSEPLRIAHHARLGGDAALAARWLVIAARQSAARFDFAGAERLATEAISLDDSAAARTERAHIRIAAGDHRGATEDAEAARRLGADLEALEVEGLVAYYRRDFSRAARIAGMVRTTPDNATAGGILGLLAGRIAHATGDLRAADAALTAPLTGDAEPIGMIWLSLLRVHEGRPDDALAVLDAYAGPTGAPVHLFAPHHELFSRGYALATLGDAAAALRVLDRLSDMVSHEASGHWAGRGENMRGWVLRNLGELGAADEWNQRGFALAEAAAYSEAQAHALLDLADGRVLAGDPEAAQQLLNRAEPLHARDHAFRWRHQLRGRLLAARIRLVMHQPEDAAAQAWSVARDATALGAHRYTVLGRLIAALAQVHVGASPNPADLEHDINALDHVAGLEAWRLTADLAAALRVDAWRTLAEHRAAGLASRAGDYEETVTRIARTRLDSTNIANRSG